MGIEMEQRGMARGGATAYAGGISISDKSSQVEAYGSHAPAIPYRDVRQSYS